MHGVVESGERRAASFVPIIEEQLLRSVGFLPFPGTLNLRGIQQEERLPSLTIEDPAIGMNNCDGVIIRPCSTAGVRAAILEPLIDEYPVWKTELVAPVSLRSLFELEDGDTITLFAPDDLWHPEAKSADAAELDSFDAVVFDLDRTLVELDVDWAAVRKEVQTLFSGTIDPFDDEQGKSVMALAREHGLVNALQRLLEEHEVNGAQTASTEPLLSVLSSLDCPIGICTKNATLAAETVFDRFEVGDYVDVIVARETVREEKPHPAPLYECLDGLGAKPGNAVFVGDDRTDCEAATSAGMNFLHPDQLNR